jgi:hypothetical protein
MKRSRLLLLPAGLLTAGLLAAAAACQAQLTWRPVPGGDVWAPPPPGPPRVGIEVLVDGRPLPTVEYAGKTYLPVPRPGAEYEVRVWNHGPWRVLAVVSVDGLSVINGRPASASRPGYVVGPYASVVIKGWRRDLGSVAAFRFVGRDESYAARVGRPEDVGVIGLVAIEERAWRPRPLPFAREAAPGGRQAQGGVGGVGTEYGREIDSGAHWVPFARSANRRSITFYYDTVAALRAAGVPVDGVAPVPFRGDGEFAPPPPGYGGR